MKSRAELKSIAKKEIKGNIGILLVINIFIVFSNEYFVIKI